MPMGMIGRKLGMTRVFLNDGTSIPVTAIEVPTNYVVQIKTPERDGYTALQVGAFEAKEKNVTKPMLGHFSKRGLKPLKVLKEFKIDDVSNYKEGQSLSVGDVFSPGELVDVVGKSKGRGFAGTMKRWDFSGFPRSHGHRYHRAVGSIGNRTDPGRVWKGKKMAGHYGNETVRVQALLVVDVIPEENVILVKGSVPGPSKGIVFIEKSRIAGRKSKKLRLERIKHITEQLVKEGEVA